MWEFFLCPLRQIQRTFVLKHRNALGQSPTATSPSGGIRHLRGRSPFLPHAGASACPVSAGRGSIPSPALLARAPPSQDPRDSILRLVSLCGPLLPASDTRWDIGDVQDIWASLIPDGTPGPCLIKITKTIVTSMIGRRYIYKQDKVRKTFLDSRRSMDMI